VRFYDNTRIPAKEYVGKIVSDVLGYIILQLRGQMVQEGLNLQQQLREKVDHREVTEGHVKINRYRYLVNNTTNISNYVYYRMMTTTCFGLFRPSSGFLPKEYWCL